MRIVSEAENQVLKTHGAIIADERMRAGTLPRRHRIFRARGGTEDPLVLLIPPEANEQKLASDLAGVRDSSLTCFVGSSRRRAKLRMILAKPPEEEPPT